MNLLGSAPKILINWLPVGTLGINTNWWLGSQLLLRTKAPIHIHRLLRAVDLNTILSKLLPTQPIRSWRGNDTTQSAKATV